MIKSGTMYALAGITGVLGLILSIVSSGLLTQTAGSTQVINWLASFSVIIGTALTYVLWVFCGTVLSHLEYLRLEHPKCDTLQDDADKDELMHHAAPTTFGRR